MSGYTFGNKGTADIQNGTSLSPGTAGASVGNLLTLAVWNRLNSNTLASIPSGWSVLSPQVNVTWDYLLGRIADGTATDTPTLTFNTSAHCGAQIAYWTGSVYATIASIVDSSADKTLPGVQTTINYPALAPIQNNCLVLYFGTKNKTATSDGTTINNLSGITKIDSHVQNGSDVSQWWGYVQQTTASNLAAVSQTFTGTTETLQNTGLVIALKSAPANSIAPTVFNRSQQG